MNIIKRFNLSIIFINHSAQVTIARMTIAQMTSAQVTIVQVTIA